MKSIPCSEIWMIGKKTADKLAQCGIRNVSQLLAADEVKIKNTSAFPLYRRSGNLVDKKYTPLLSSINLRSLFEFLALLEHR